MLYGLILTGGKSTRMGEDKSRLIYRGNTPEWLRIHSILNDLCEQVYLCHREGQNYEKQAIIDPGRGPLVAIHTAQKVHPGIAWLVVACDMPLVEFDTLKHLVSHRDSNKSGTCYLSPIDQQAEPLCSIFEPSTAKDVELSIAKGNLCPRHILTHAHHIPPLSIHSLINANSSADKAEVEAILNGTQFTKLIEVRYFAQMKETTKKDSEYIKTKYVTCSGLFEQLKTRYQFSYKQKDLMLAINDEFAQWNTPLNNGDRVVFIPPVAGG